MHVPYLGLKEQFRDFHTRPEWKEYFADCQFVLGPAVEQFEKRFSELCGVKHAIGVNSGTDALILALKAQGVGPGDEVITAPNSFIATAGAIAAVGARPVFVDVADDYNINPNLIETAVTQRTKALLPVHLTGNPAQMKQIMSIALDHKLVVVGDACQAVGARIGDRPAASFGVDCFSLHPLKNLNVCGDGGVVTVDSDEIGDRIRRLRNHGLVSRDESSEFGFCSRLDTFQATVANIGLDTLEEVTAARIRNAQEYDRLLKSLARYVIIPPRRQGVRQVFHTYVVQVERRTELIEFLSSRAIETKIHYPIPIHLQAAASHLGYKKGDFPVCERQSESIISLPVNQYLIPEQIAYVVESMEEFYG